MWVCVNPVCEAENDEDSTVCIVCGQSSLWTCGNRVCGASNLADSLQCIVCDELRTDAPKVFSRDDAKGRAAKPDGDAVPLVSQDSIDSFGSSGRKRRRTGPADHGKTKNSSNDNGNYADNGSDGGADDSKQKPWHIDFAEDEDAEGGEKEKEKQKEKEKEKKKKKKKQDISGTEEGKKCERTEEKGYAAACVDDLVQSQEVRAKKKKSGKSAQGSKPESGGRGNVFDSDGGGGDDGGDSVFDGADDFDLKRPRARIVSPMAGKAEKRARAEEAKAERKREREVRACLTLLQIHV
jgi:hypothetical protein